MDAPLFARPVAIGTRPYSHPRPYCSNVVATGTHARLRLPTLPNSPSAVCRPRPLVGIYILWKVQRATGALGSCPARYRSKLVVPVGGLPVHTLSAKCSCRIAYAPREMCPGPGSQQLARGEDYTVQGLRDARIVEVFLSVADYVPVKERRRRWLLDRSNTLQVHAAGEIGQCSRDPLALYCNLAHHQLFSRMTTPSLSGAGRCPPSNWARPIPGSTRGDNPGLWRTIQAASKRGCSGASNCSLPLPDAARMSGPTQPSRPPSPGHPPGAP